MVEAGDSCNWQVLLQVLEAMMVVLLMKIMTLEFGLIVPLFGEENFFVKKPGNSSANCNPTETVYASFVHYF